MASIHGTVSTILAVQMRAPCSPCMNWLRVQFWLSMPSFIHCDSSHFSNGVPVTSKSARPRPSALFWSALAMTTRSWSTTVSHGRSVSPFHMETLAFSYSLSSAGRAPLV